SFTRHWYSDVCSSDLQRMVARALNTHLVRRGLDETFIRIRDGRRAGGWGEHDPGSGTGRFPLRSRGVRRLQLDQSLVLIWRYGPYRESVEVRTEGKCG